MASDFAKRLSSWRVKQGFEVQSKKSEEESEESEEQSERRGPAPLDLTRWAHRIGRVSDADIARMAGCTPDIVRRYRKRHGIAAYSVAVDLDEYDAQILAARGSLKLARLAEALGVSQSTLYRRQRKLLAERKAARYAKNKEDK